MGTFVLCRIYHTVYQPYQMYVLSEIDKMWHMVGLCPLLGSKLPFSLHKTADR
jgi:hypothetical protein